MKFIRDCFTGKDCTTWDLGRVLWGVFGVLLALPATQALYYHDWTARDWATWTAAVCAHLMAGGGALLFKASTEPAPIKGDNQ